MSNVVIQFLLFLSEEVILNEDRTTDEDKLRIMEGKPVFFNQLKSKMKSIFLLISKSSFKHRSVFCIFSHSFRH